MLKLQDITRVYSEGDTRVQALRGISLEFGESEFAAILGPSGCGKTTLLNIIGGLDQYTSGDLIIRGKTTREFTERDWDTYRNHSVGFVFQSYNLIPHQTALSNVELALTLSGVSREERRRRAIEALEQVGLGDQLKKKPNQMSGGQMQRVAIARALVNDPEVLLADEPTGALDSDTSIQVMDILRKVSRDRLVIMVTHNPELANQYATRIIRLLDGQIVSDSRTSVGDTQTEAPEAAQNLRKTSMNFLTALSLSLNNLMTKKGRTILTAFAGSIGIIGIALILSLSNGVNRYIERVQRDTLSSYPLEIDEQTVDMTDTMAGLLDMDLSEGDRENGKVYSGGRLTQMMSSWMSGITENDLGPFKAWLESPETGMDQYVSGISYEYDTPLLLYRTDLEAPLQVNPSTVMEATGMTDMINIFPGTGTGIQETMMNTTMRRLNVFSELLDNEELLRSQYTVVTGRFPRAKDEVVILLNSRNELSDYCLYSLGLRDQSELKDQFQGLMRGEAIESEEMVFSYEDLMSLRFRLLINTDRYTRSGSLWVDSSGDPEFLSQKLSEALELRVVGILRPAEGSLVAETGGIGYLRELMEDLLLQVRSSEIAQEQLSNPETDIFTGHPFSAVAQDALTLLDSMEVEDFLALLEEKGLIPAGMIPKQFRSFLTKDLLKQFVGKGVMMISGNTLEANLEKIGISDPAKPAAILIYPKNFESKKKITQLIEGYNMEAGERKAVHYTDYVGLMMDSVTTIVNAISYVLVAFVAISLIVSSIMIGIITYISVLERTKEIGILRAIGASRKDISRVFNAETLIIGFAAGVMGILVTLGLTVIANIILGNLTGIPDIAALPPLAGVILVLISMVLTLIAGIIPSRIASRKNPVAALRTE
ncbi:MAG: ABC transporter ATP-binding protein/permease [Clostridiales bacterium]|nr:ABC transporter ATP-binding protein/permease [Clostridiales bacterium]